MKSARTTAAGVALAIAVVPVTLAGCGSQPATPAAAPSSTPAAPSCWSGSPRRPGIAIYRS